MSDVVVFDVGGKRFSTTLKTLQRYPESFLPAMCKDCHDAVGTGKEIHVDRSPEGFTWIMEIYRGCPIKIGQSIPSNWGLTDMEDELNFYQLPTDQLLPPFHGETLFRREKEALKKLGDQILGDLKKDQESLFFAPHVGFCVWVGEIRKSATLNTLYLGEDTSHTSLVQKINRSQSHYAHYGSGGVAKDGNGSWRIPGQLFLSLRKNQLVTLAEHLRKFGFNISQCRTSQDSYSSPDGIPFLMVSWQNE